MHVYDWIILGIIGLGAWNGYRTGAIAQLLRTIGTIASYWIALQYHSFVAPVIQSLIQRSTFGKSQSPLLLEMFSQGVSFMTTFLLVSFLFGILALFVQGIFRLPGLSFINRVLGFIVGGALTIIVITILIQVSTYVHIPAVQKAVQSSTIAQALDRSFWGFFHAVTPNRTNNPFHVSE